MGLPSGACAISGATAKTRATMAINNTQSFLIELSWDCPFGLGRIFVLGALNANTITGSRPPVTCFHLFILGDVPIRDGLLSGPGSDPAIGLPQSASTAARR